MISQRPNPPWIPVLCFVIDGGFAVVVDRLTDLVQHRYGGGGSADAWMIFLGVAVDLFSDGT